MSTQPIVDPNECDRFILRQQFRLVVNQYEFSLPGPNDTPGRVFCFVRQKMFKFKEDVRFFTDESMSTEILRIKARQRFDPTATYDVTMPDGTKIGGFQKVFGKSLLRSSYRLLDANGQEVATATELKLWVALLRRLVGFIPNVGNFANWLPIPYHFVFQRGERVLGHHKRQLWKFNDTYTLDLTPDTDRTLDRRLVMAIAVAMDAFQAR
ncbi:MAG TPA: hypothetical protein VG408_09175 [Actinomycetota bacterium]|nr:hypothetical protein [Actinomycetota bacterium]